MLSIVIIVIVIALMFDFLNGMADAGNSIATVVSTKVLPPLIAVIWAAFFNFAAVFFFGVHVATTIGKGIVDVSVITEYVILAALIGAVIWVFTCVQLGLPISVSHSLIGGLIGPALIVGGKGALISSGIIKITVFIVLSPVLGMVMGYLFMTLTMVIFRRQAPMKVDHLFRGLQLVSSAIFSIGHGSNDAQKTMGIISLLLFSTGRIGPEFHIPYWVIIACYSAISLGTLFGGWKVIKTLGLSLTDLKPVHGFCAETAGAITIIGTSLAGIPVSTTHTITGSIMGVGMTRRLSAVRWVVAQKIVIAWVLTIPGAMVISSGVYFVISLFL
jgi:inorganic phosphate transporter, PiT family